MSYLTTGIGAALGLAIGCALFDQDIGHLFTAIYYTWAGLFIHWFFEGRKKTA